MNRYPIITLCSSTKFKDEFIRLTEEFALKGYIVLSVGLFGHADNKFGTIITPEVKNMLDELHKAKIKMSDEVFIINKNHYIGDSTKSEIEYAKSLNIPIHYLENNI